MSAALYSYCLNQHDIFVHLLLSCHAVFNVFSILTSPAPPPPLPSLSSRLSDNFDNRNVGRKKVKITIMKAFPVLSYHALSCCCCRRHRQTQETNRAVVHPPFALLEAALYSLHTLQVRSLRAPSSALREAGKPRILLFPFTAGVP
jgi:hypothetical protein